MTDCERQWVTWFEQHEPRVSKAVQATLLRRCAPSSDRRCSIDDDGFPPITNEQELKQKVGLYTVNIHQLDVDGIPYIGCDWDEAHGRGVLMHGERAVEIGHADTAFHLWGTRADAERRGTG